jgi:hypothetical protein
VRGAPVAVEDVVGGVQRGRLREVLDGLRVPTGGEGVVAEFLIGRRKKEACESRSGRGYEARREGYFSSWRTRVRRGEARRAKRLRRGEAR